MPFNLRGYQEKLINHFNDNRFSVVLASRQSGKSITSCAYLTMVHTVYTRSYSCDSANKGAIAREMIASIVTMLSQLPFFLQPV